VFSKKQMINLLSFAALPSMIAAALFAVCATQAHTFVSPSGETWYDPFSWYGDESRTMVIQGVQATFTMAAIAAGVTAIAGLLAARNQAKVYGEGVHTVVQSSYVGLARRHDISDLRDEVRELIAQSGMRRGSDMIPPEGGAPKGQPTADGKNADKAKAEIDAINAAVA